MKTTIEISNKTYKLSPLIEISNGAKTYKLSPFGDEIYIENEKGKAMTISERDLFDLVHEYFEERF